MTPFCLNNPIRQWWANSAENDPFHPHILYFWPETWPQMTLKIFWIRISLNSNFANVQIDLDNLAQVLGSTSIQVGSKSGQINSSNTTSLPDDNRDCEIAISAAKNNCSGHTHCSASPTVSPLPDQTASHDSSLPVFNVVTPPPKVPSMTSSVNSSPIGLQNRNSLTIGSDDYYWFGRPIRLTPWETLVPTKYKVPTELGFNLVNWIRVNLTVQVLWKLNLAKAV